MGQAVFGNNVSSTLAVGITALATSITVATGDGAKFPALTGGNWFIATLSDSATNTVLEIVQVTAVVGDVLTVVRGYESTTGTSYLAGDLIGVRLTAGSLNQMAPAASPALTGIPTVPTATAGTSTTQAASTAFVTASPVFTGTPTAPTAAQGTSTTQLATTAFVTASPSFTGVPLAPTAAAGTATTQIATTAFTQLYDPMANEFRLTLTTVTPVTIVDVIGATVLYCSPYKGNHIALYNGSVWGMYTSAEFSIALGTLTATLPYDVFCYANGTVPTLEILAWTSSTARATGLVLQNGVLVKNGSPTRRYLGTFYTTSTTTTEDSDANRYLYNYYNRIQRRMYKQFDAASWTYAVAAWRQANNSVANQVNFLIGVQEDAVFAVQNSIIVLGVSTNTAQIGLGLNRVTGNDSVRAYTTGVSAVTFVSDFNVIPPLGKNFIAGVEYSAGTNTFYGSVDGLITGFLRA